MKKKRVFTTMATAALSAILCLGFVACGENEKNDGSSDGDKQQPDTVTDANAAFTVTEAEWKDAFDFANKNCTVSLYRLMSDTNGQFALVGNCYFTGDGNAWLENELAPGLSEELNFAYALSATDAYEHFTFDATTKSYKSTSEWVCGMTSPETPTELEGEVEFYEGKLVSCIVFSNLEWMGIGGSVSARGAYKITVSDYGTTVAPDVSENE